MHDPAIRYAVVGAWLDGKSGREISALVGLNGSTVRAIIKRTRDAGAPLDRRAAPPHSAVLIKTVLDRWVAGWTDAEIREEIGLEDIQIHYIVHRARAAGDARAVRRLPARTSNAYPADKRTGEEAVDLRERVLSLWHEGLRAKPVASACGIMPAYVYTIVRDARDAGDARAQRRRFAA